MTITLRKENVMTVEQGHLRGHEVIDVDGEVVGTVSDVFYDDHLNRPKWLVVDPGVFRKERLVPIDGAYETDDGKIVLPYDKQWVKNGPAVSGDHYPDRATTQRASQHYELDS
jgi:sporulation protein YlmC with PRC-barrel domain